MPVEELCMELTHYGVTLGQLDASQVQMLLDEALDYAAASWQSFGTKMVAAQHLGYMWSFRKVRKKHRFSHGKKTS